MIAGVTERARKAAGTYGFLDVLRHPSRMVRPPGPNDGASDIEAIRSGETRRVSCFLRGEGGPYPKKLKQGRLVLGKDQAAWTPYWSVSRKPIDIDRNVTSVQSRPADGREPNVKKGGTAFGVVQIPAFMVVTCNGHLDQ